MDAVPHGLKTPPQGTIWNLFPPCSNSQKGVGVPETREVAELLLIPSETAKHLLLRFVCHLQTRQAVLQKFDLETSFKTSHRQMFPQNCQLLMYYFKDIISQTTQLIVDYECNDHLQFKSHFTT